MAGSRFTNAAESRYAPVEGEALAIAEALERCRLFVPGCEHLLIATDHKPLTKILGNKELGDIHNPRLLRIKERTLMYKYQLTHVPGGWHSGPDALSRYPPRRDDPASSAGMEGEVHAATVAALHSGDHDGIRAETWERLRDASATDPTSRDLVETIASGFPLDIQGLPTHLRP